MKKPPATVTIAHCPECGRNDRFMPFTGRGHFAKGERCQGSLIRVTYRVVK